MLPQQVGEQPYIFLTGEDGAGGYVVAAALALIERSVFLNQFAAVDGAVRNQDTGCLFWNIEQQERMGLTSANLAHIWLGHGEGVVYREMFQRVQDHRGFGARIVH